MTNITVEVFDKRYIRLGARLTDFVKRVLSFLEKKDFGVTVFLITGKESRRLNKEYRNIDKEASVLSFEEKDDWPSIDSRFLGEIYITPAVLKKKGYTVQLITVHGILHLLGFNHRNSKETAKMQSLEEKILESVEF